MSAPTSPAPTGYDAGLAAPMSPQRLARLTGAMYVLLVGLGMMGPLTLESMLVAGDAAATAANVSEGMLAFDLSLVAWVVIVVVDVAISITLYLLLAPAGRGLSLVTAAFRLVYSAALATLLVHLFTAHQLLTPDGAPARGAEQRALESLEVFSSGFLVALVFFGAHLVLLGILFARSHYIPAVLAWLLVAAGVGYVVDSLASLTVNGYGGLLPVLLLTPAVLGEVGLTLWLLVKGVTPGRR